VRELSLRKAKVEGTTIVKFRVKRRGGNSASSGIVKERAYIMKTMDVVEARFTEVRNLILIGECKVMVEDETQIMSSMRQMNNRLRWQIKNRSVKFRELLRKANKKPRNSVLEVLRVRRLVDIQSEILCSVRQRESMEWVKYVQRKDRHEKLSVISIEVMTEGEKRKWCWGNGEEFEQI
jgi:hypothetical protein